MFVEFASSRYGVFLAFFAISFISTAHILMLMFSGTMKCAATSRKWVTVVEAYGNKLPCVSFNRTSSKANTREGSTLNLLNEDVFLILTWYPGTVTLTDSRWRLVQRTTRRLRAPSGEKMTNDDCRTIQAPPSGLVTDAVNSLAVYKDGACPAILGLAAADH